MDAQAVTDAFTQAAAGYYQQKEDEFTAPVMREVEPGHTVRCHLIDK